MKGIQKTIQAMQPVQKPAHHSRVGPFPSRALFLHRMAAHNLHMQITMVGCTFLPV